MKVETLYICEKCGLKYTKEEDAIACEATHVDIEKVIGRFFVPSSKQRKYPNNILVKTEDGQYLNYAFVDPLSKEQIDKIIESSKEESGTDTPDPTEHTEPTEPSDPTETDPTEPIDNPDNTDISGD